MIAADLAVIPEVLSRRVSVAGIICPAAREKLRWTPGPGYTSVVLHVEAVRRLPSHVVSLAARRNRMGLIEELSSAVRPVQSLLLESLNYDA